MTVAIKNLAKHTLVFGGKIIAGAESIKCDWEETERYSSYIDPQGNTVIVKNGNTNMIIDIEISEANFGNDILSLYYTLHQSSDIGYPLMFKDENGATLITSTKAMVWKTAPVESKKEHSLRGWQVYATNCGYFAGGIKTS